MCPLSWRPSEKLGPFTLFLSGRKLPPFVLAVHGTPTNALIKMLLRGLLRLEKRLEEVQYEPTLPFSDNKSHRKYTITWNIRKRNKSQFYS